jgi:hypothetical protein
MRLTPLLATVALVLTAARSVHAQQRPLPTEPLNGVGEGNASVQLGVDYSHNTQFTLSGLQGNLWRVALIQIDVGLGSIADFELSGGLRDHLSITSTKPAPLSGVLDLSDPNSTGAFDDILVATKVRVLADSAERPGIALKFATRLPNAKHPSGLGQDTTDFFGTLILGHNVAGHDIVANAGVGVLGDPLQGNRRVASFLYNVMVAHPVTDRVSAIVGLDGRTGPAEPGLESRAVARIGVSRSEGPIRVRLDGTWGLTDRDGSVGFALNATYTFHAFTP